MSQQPNWQTHDQTEISLTLGVVSSPHKDKTNSPGEPPQASFTNKPGKSLGKYSRILTHKPTNSKPVDPHVVSISNLDVICIFSILFQTVLYPRPSFFKTPGISIIGILQPSMLAVMFCSSRSMVVCHSRCLHGGGARVLDACCMSRATAKDSHMHNIQHICQKQKYMLPVVIKLCLYLCAQTPTTDKCTTYVYHAMQFIYVTIIKYFLWSAKA